MNRGCFATQIRTTQKELDACTIGEQSTSNEQNNCKSCFSETFLVQLVIPEYAGGKGGEVR